MENFKHTDTHTHPETGHFTGNLRDTDLYNPQIQMVSPRISSNRSFVHE